MLTFLADWLSGSHKQALAGSLAAFAGHPAYIVGPFPSVGLGLLPHAFLPSSGALRSGRLDDAHDELARMLLDQIDALGRKAPRRSSRR